MTDVFDTLLQRTLDAYIEVVVDEEDRERERCAAGRCPICRYYDRG